MNTENVREEQPVMFIGHGSPMVAIEFDDWNENLCAFVDRNSKPSAIVVISAHWETKGSIQITSNDFPEQIYDFYGFPETLYNLTYPCEGSFELAQSIEFLLKDIGIDVISDENRGLDHGVWIPLYVTFPNADIPVIQISIPSGVTAKKMFNIGNALASLRKQGVLLIGSGGIVHNLAKAKLDEKYASPDKWAIESENWVLSKLQDFNIEELIEYETNIPNKSLSIPTPEHFLPLFFVLGAINQKDHFINIHQGFHYGNVSMFSFAYSKNL